MAPSRQFRRLARGEELGEHWEEMGARAENSETTSRTSNSVYTTQRQQEERGTQVCQLGAGQVTTQGETLSGTSDPQSSRGQTGHKDLNRWRRQNETQVGQMEAGTQPQPDAQMKLQGGEFGGGERLKCSPAGQGSDFWDLPVQQKLLPRCAISTGELASQLARLWKEDEKSPLVGLRSGFAAASAHVVHHSLLAKQTAKHV
ncbi:hypothetical protein D4764_19G0009470 [Takifugu flavidus]|uniref:Uncharacterized protein n=1 Tax=Takifugu flavidus TaxID=433684 RepID=A0A5C6NQZ1_9TELE|nr:hypothetical protein D4764_19G0009470 [Takifugu flavidus]